MTFTKLTFAALVLGASFTPALAESGDLAQGPVAAYEQSIGNPAAKPAMIEGRQAATIAAPVVTGTTTYLDGRTQDQNR